MITLKYKNLRKGDLNGASAKLSNAKKFHPSQALQVFKIVDQLFDKNLIIAEEYTALAASHAVLDEKGLMKPKEDHMGNPRPNSFVSKDSAAWEKAVVDFGETEFKIFGEKFPMSILEGLELSPLEMAALEPLIKEGDLDGSQEESKESEKTH